VVQQAFNDEQRGGVVISDNQIDYAQSLGPYVSKNQGTVFVHFIGDRPSSTLQIQNNSFTHTSGTCGQIIVNGAQELNLTGNVFTDTNSSDVDRPAVLITQTSSVNATGNTFANQQACLKYTSPTSDSGVSVAQLIFASNTVHSPASFDDTIVTTDGQLGAIVSGNIRYRLAIGAPFVDSRLLIATNAGANSKFVLMGNLLHQTNYSTSNYYQIDGVDVATGANILASNNV
jgi:hypothetical protein